MKLILVVALLFCVGCGAEEALPKTELEALIVIENTLEWCVMALFMIATALFYIWSDK